MSRLRVGIGFDAHAFTDGRALVLAGIEIPWERGLAGHSDADLVSHAVTDALLAAAWRGLAERGWAIVNVDAVVIMEEPRLAPHREAMRARLAEALRIEAARVTVRASTTDMLGFTGRGEGAACQAVALLEHRG